MLLAALLAPLLYRSGDLAMSGGAARTLLFTRVPRLSGATRAADPRIAATNGLLTQFVAAGALLGPYPASPLPIGNCLGGGKAVAAAIQAALQPAS